MSSRHEVDLDLLADYIGGALAGTPDELRRHTSADVVSLAPGETWEA